MVEYAWLIPALPLAALIIVLLVTRPLELANRPRLPRPAGDTHGAHGATESHADVEHGAPAAHADDAGHGAGHDEHGASTPFWAQTGSVIAVLAMLGAFIISAIILFQFIGGNLPGADKEGGVSIHLFDWITLGSGPDALKYTIDLRIDTLTAIMLVVVTGVSMLVHLYSVGYMAGDPGYSRFFIELSLFTGWFP